MLVVKVFSNENKIGEVHIQNMGPLINQSAIYEYNIVRPEGDYRTILHKRADGWMPLVREALGEMVERWNDET